MKNVKFLMVVSLCLVAAAATVWADEVRIVGNQAGSNVCPWWGSGHASIRFMALWEKSEIGLTRGGYINKVEFMRSATNSGTFNNVRAYFGHSTRTELDPTFNNNYSDTPVQVLNAASKTVSGSSGQWWDLGIDANKFNYNNTNNLVLEIRWRGGTGTNCACWCGSGGMKRCWAFDDTATVAAYRFGQIQYLRLTVSNATGVAPTSLGRVKSLFR
jgi:hypothetical protein